MATEILKFASYFKAPETAGTKLKTGIIASLLCILYLVHLQAPPRIEKRR